MPEQLIKILRQQKAVDFPLFSFCWTLLFSAEENDDSSLLKGGPDFCFWTFRDGFIGSGEKRAVEAAAVCRAYRARA
jgi:hypothetical protein